MAKNNLLLFHGGGPTAVINASLYGAVRQAKEDPSVGLIMAAAGGSGGLLRESFINLRDIPEDRLDMLPQSPGSAIGTSRDRLRDGEYRRIAEILRKYDFNCVLGNGGNGTMDTCGRLAEHCEKDGIRVIGIPKTIDNDISITDHCPGYGSAARFVAGSVAELSLEVQSLPIHVVILETMGRNVGWLAAAAALGEGGDCPGPDLIYTPEQAFDEEAFLENVNHLHRVQGGVLVVVSEGLKCSTGESIVPPIFTVGRDVYFGDVSAYLAQRVTQRLGIKARSEKPGLLGRASIAWQSGVDRQEAEWCGREAVRAVLAGESAQMVALRRPSDGSYRVEPFLAPLRQVMMEERPLPASFWHPQGGVTEAFRQWCRPLLGGPLPPMVSFHPRGH